MANSPHSSRRGADRDQVAAIYAPIQTRLDKVERRLEELADVDFPFLSQLLTHVYGSGGKRARPAITLLASSFYEHDERKSEVMAVAVELLHIATLIHDDTVDESDTRRGRWTISSMFGKDIAVLVGDYVFASSATFVCDTGHVGVIRRFSETIMELSSGELEETSKRRQARSDAGRLPTAHLQQDGIAVQHRRRDGRDAERRPAERGGRPAPILPRARHGVPDS